MKKRTQWLTVTALGIALFVVLSLVLRIPVLGRFYLCLGYLVMGIYCYYFGTLSGTLTGSIGVVIYCLIFGAIGGMIGWALGNIVIGIAVGTVCRLTKKFHTEVLRQLLLMLTAVLSTAVGMLLIKSGYESLLSGLPFLLRLAANMTAFLADSVVLICSFPLALTLRRILPKQFPLLCQ